MAERYRKARTLPMEFGEGLTCRLCRSRFWGVRQGNTTLYRTINQTISQPLFI